MLDFFNALQNWLQCGYCFKSITQKLLGGMICNVKFTQMRRFCNLISISQFIGYHLYLFSKIIFKYIYNFKITLQNIFENIYLLGKSISLILHVIFVCRITIFFLVEQWIYSLTITITIKKMYWNCFDSF